MKSSNQIGFRLSRAAAIAAGALWVANVGVASVEAATSVNTSGAVLQGNTGGTNATNNAATTISFSGQTALRNFDTSFAIQQLQPGTSITLHNGANGAAVTYTAPNETTTNVKLASNNFGAADVWKLNGSAVAVGTAGAQIQTNSALRLEWHEQGSIDGFYDLLNDQIGYPQNSTEATNAGTTALGTLRPVGPLSVLAQRYPPVPTRLG